MIETIVHNGNKYPIFQSTGNAARFAIPFAQQVIGDGKIGFDIGCNRKEWAYPDAYTIDPEIDPTFDAYNLMPINVDYIFSSHCLEHLPDWVKALDYWKTKLHVGGVLFLYLPDYSQTYWRPWHNRKHVHSFRPDMIRDFLIDRGWGNVFVSGVDLNNSFIAIAEKV